MGVIGAQGTGIQAPERDPFVPGRVVSPRGTGMIKDSATGEITYFGSPTLESEPDPVVQEQMEQAQKLQAVDSNQMLEKQQIEGLTKLDTIFSQAEEQITKQRDYALQQSNEEYQIKLGGLEKQHLGPTPKGKTAQDQLDAFDQARQKLDMQMQLAQLKIEGKIKPDLDLLALEKEQRVSAIQEDFKKKSAAIQEINSLEADGTIPDPIRAQVRRLQIAGMNVSVTDLKPAITPEQELRQVSQDYTALNNLLFDPKFRKAATMEQVQEVQFAIAQIGKKQAELIPKVYGDKYAEVAEKKDKLKTDLANVIIPLTNQPVSTIGTLVSKEKEKVLPTKQLDEQSAIALLQEAGGDKNKARMLARQRGYKF